MSEVAPRFTLMHAFWVLWFLQFVALEFYAVGNPTRGDTLTETVKTFMGTSFWFRVAVQGLLFWLIFHFDLVATVREAIHRVSS